MRIAVIGAGVMGTGIAYAASLAGNSVMLHDCDSSILEKAHQQIRALGEKGVARGKIQKDEWENAIHKLSKATDLKRAVEGADLVIEAVVGDLKMKLDVFKSIDGLALKEREGRSWPDSLLGRHTTCSAWRN